jgi:adenosylcobyric acid synthase
MNNSKKIAKAIAILGTGSDVGKSLITAGLCRLLHRAGLRVAPFKAQNMSNNSYVTPDGKEIGRAQALQAQACGLEPHTDMNPVLLKPESDCRAQVVVQGTVWGKADARDYGERWALLAQRIRESYERLAKQYDVIVIEGAGSAAEVNLRDRDLANWSAVELADASVVLVADIDRGGVFAQVLGTLDLLRSHERARVVGILINKFRGDATLFADGVAFLEERTGLPVLGVVPFLQDLALDQEDSVDIERHHQVSFDLNRVNIAIVLLPRMSNFTDFNQLMAEDDVALRYVAMPGDLSNADVVLIPGSKNTIEDLRYLRRSGFSQAFSDHVASGRELVGICGGYQMLGRDILDPDGIESEGKAKGFGLLDLTTRLFATKITHLVEAIPLDMELGSACSIRGYYIHMGTTLRGAVQPYFQVRTVSSTQIQQGGAPADFLDGAASADGRIWGTYIHGVFDQPDFRRAWLNRIRCRKGWSALSLETSERVTQRLNGELDRWAEQVKSNLNLKIVLSCLDR